MVFAGSERYAARVLPSPVTIQAAILQVLLSAPAHGWAIRERLRGYADGELRLAEGALYEQLRGLERQGLVFEALAPRRRPQPGRPPKPYALTLEGQVLARLHRDFLKKLLGYEDSARPRWNRP